MKNTTDIGSLAYCNTKAHDYAPHTAMKGYNDDAHSLCLDFLFRCHLLLVFNLGESKTFT